MATERSAIDPVVSVKLTTRDLAVDAANGQFLRGVASRSSDRMIATSPEDRLERGADRNSHSCGTSILFRLGDLAKRVGVQAWC